MEHVEVAIIGGGLAGSAAAITLAEAGKRVVMLERDRYPRHKMCGEFLSPETIPIFQRLGVWETIQALNPARLTGVRLTATSGQVFNGTLPRAAIGLSRYVLDALLAERARTVGAEVRDGCAVRNVEGSLQEGFTVTTQGYDTVHAATVIGAWGKRATLDRVLERPFFEQPAPFMALKIHARGPQPAQRVELHGFDGGYCGISAIEGDHVNVCLLTHTHAWERSGKQIDAFWQMIQAENPYLKQQLKGMQVLTDDIVISNISFTPKGPLVGDILVAGDSAELISPLAGNGQAMALQAGLMAANTVTHFLDGVFTVATLKQEYATRWRRHFRERLWLGRTLQPLFLNPRALSIGLRLGRLFPSAVNWLIDGTRERQ